MPGLPGSGRLVIASVLATMLAPAAIAQPGDDAIVDLVRAGIDLACHAADIAELTERAAAAPIFHGLYRVRRTPGRDGWSGRLLVDGGFLSLHRLAPDGRLREVRVRYDSVAQRPQRPLMLVIADFRCAIHTVRRLVYDAYGKPEWLEHVDPLFVDTLRREPINPPVPVYPDPGGIAVGLVDTGVNYLLPEIARRLARDRHGEPLGYDYWDLDRRPFDADPVHSVFFPRRHGTGTASLLAREAPVARLVPYRYPRPDMARMAALIEDAAAHGVRILNVSLAGRHPGNWEAYRRAAAANPQMLFVVAAGNQGRDLDVDPMYPAALPLANQITVTSATGDGRLQVGANWGSIAVDLMVAADSMRVIGFDGDIERVSGSSYAAARVSALAACLAIERPTWQARQLKAAILARAGPSPDSARVAHGFIADPVAGDRGRCRGARPSSGL